MQTVPMKRVTIIGELTTRSVAHSRCVLFAFFTLRLPFVHRNGKKLCSSSYGLL
jgi:hypothetical protein